MLIEAVLLTLGIPDRPVDREADVWQVRAPVDAFYFYGRQLTEEDLTRLRDAIVKVFGKQPEQPSRDQNSILPRLQHLITAGGCVMALR